MTSIKKKYVRITEDEFLDLFEAFRQALKKVTEEELELLSEDIVEEFNRRNEVKSLKADISYAQKRLNEIE